MYRKLIFLISTKNKDSFRNILLFFALFCALIILPCSVITYHADGLITRKISANNKNFLHAASSTLDNALSSASDQAMALARSNSSDYHTLLHTEDLRHTAASLALYHFDTALRESLFNSDLFSDVFLYFKNPGIVFTQSGTFNAEDFFTRYRVFEDYPEDFFDELMKKDYKNTLCPPTNIRTCTTTGQFSDYGRCLPFAVNLSGYRASDAVLVLLVKESLLNQTLGRLNNDQTSYLYLLDTQSRTILNQPAEEDYASILALSAFDWNASEGETICKADDTYRIYWKKSPVHKLLYLDVEPGLLITRQLHSFLALTLVVMLTAILLAVLLHFILFHRIRETVSSILKRLHQADIPSVPADTSPVNTGFQDLRAAVELLCERQENDRPQLINAFFSGLFTGNMETEAIDSFCSRLSLFAPDAVFCIAIFKLNHLKNGQPVPDLSSASDTLPSLQELFRNLPDSFGYRVSSSPSFFLCFMDAPDETLIKRKLYGLELYLKLKLKDFPSEYKGVFSPVFQDIHETFHFYTQALNLFESHGTAADKTMYTQEDISASLGKLLPEHKKQVTSLLKTAPGQCSAYVEKLLSDFRQKDIPFSQLRSIVQEILFLLQEGLYEQAIRFSSVFSMEEHEFLSVLHAILLPENLKNFGCHFFHIYASLQKNNGSAVSSSEQTLLDFIDSHLADIHLTLLADAVGMNQNYLSQYFKKHFGITFVDYVTRKKIDRAKELLVTTSLTCKAIGESLGYHDPNVFTRTFKKMEAITPNEYRRIHQN